METTIQKIYDILIEAGINKKKIEKQNEDLIFFVHKKIEYSVQIEDDGDIAYGPWNFENNALNSDYLGEVYTEYGTIVDFEDYIHYVVDTNPYTDLYNISDKLLKLETEAENLDIDFEQLVNHMFGYR